MRFVVTSGRSGVHTSGVTGVAWTSETGVVSVSDDQTLRMWNGEGEPLEATLGLDGFYATSLCLAPGGGKGAESGSSAKGGGSRSGAVGSSDGSLRLFSSLPKWETVVEEAHEGAVLGVAYTADGGSLASCGEDGALKVWSRTGVLRSVLLTQPRPVYALAWGVCPPGAEDSSSSSSSGSGGGGGAPAVAVTAGSAVIVKPIDPSRKMEKWKAHDGLVLALDWCRGNGLLVTGGEDGVYKVWDAFGRPLYAGSGWENAITSIAWAPDGSLFAVGSYETLALADASGWTHSLDAVRHAGSIQALEWSSDSSHVVGAGAGGEVVFGYVSGRHVAWRNFDVTLVEPTLVRVVDVANEFEDELSFRDRVVKLSLAGDHLVAATTHQIHIYATDAWSTPVITDVRTRIDAILQTSKYFGLLDTSSGLTILSYDGRVVSSPRLRLGSGDILSPDAVSLSPDTVAVVDPSNGAKVLLFDTGSGRALDEVIVSSRPIAKVALSQTGSPSERKVVFVDTAGELWIASVVAPEPVRLATMVSAVAWSETGDMLVAYSDSSLVTWYYPAVAFLASSLVDATKTADASLASTLGRSPEILSFVDTHVTLRTDGGALAHATISPYPQMLAQYAASRDWKDAVNLCRFVNSELEWAVLAALAVAAKELGPAEIAFAQINQVDKLEHISRIAAIPSPDRRLAELALFCGKPDEAEAALLKANLVYWAVDLNIRLFKWSRALDIAQRHDPSLEPIVCTHRSDYLEDFDRAESDEAFLAAQARVDIDIDRIRELEAGLRQE